MILLPFPAGPTLLFWTLVAMTGFRTHPEHTPALGFPDALGSPSLSAPLCLLSF